MILLADADSDGHHITTLLLTFIYPHLPQLIARQRPLATLCRPGQLPLQLCGVGPAGGLRV